MDKWALAALSLQSQCFADGLGRGCRAEGAAGSREGRLKQIAGRPCPELLIQLEPKNPYFKHVPSDAAGPRTTPGEPLGLGHFTSFKMMGGIDDAPTA